MLYLLVWLLEKSRWYVWQIVYEVDMTDGGVVCACWRVDCAGSERMKFPVEEISLNTSI